MTREFQEGGRTVDGARMSNATATLGDGGSRIVGDDCASWIVLRFVETAWRMKL